MGAEAPRQQDMFTGEWVDNRSSYRKRLDREHEQPRQGQLFSAREVVQHEARRRPWLNDLPAYSIDLEREETRTPEEIERDRLREAQSLTPPMFDSDAPVPVTEPISPTPILMNTGLRARLRAQSVPVRRRSTPLATPPPE
jgi:hypothetical protein